MVERRLKVSSDHPVAFRAETGRARGRTVLCRGQGPIRHREMAKKNLCLNQHKGKSSASPLLDLPWAKSHAQGGRR